MSKFINKSLCKKELKENKGKFLLCFLLFAAAAFFVVFIYQSENLLKGSVSREAFPVLPVAAETLYENFAYYAFSCWNARYSYQLGTLTAIILGAGAFSSERARNTLVFLSGTPLSRRAIFDTKAAVGLMYLSACVLGGIVFLIFGATFSGHVLPSGLFFAQTLVILAGLWVIYLVTLIFSLFSTDPVKTGAFSAFFWFVLSIPGWFSATKTYSIFYHMQSWSLFLERSFPWVFFASMVVLCAVLRLAGQILWSKEDI